MTNQEEHVASGITSTATGGVGIGAAKLLRDAKYINSSLAFTLALTSIRSLFAFHILGPALMGAWRSAAAVDTMHEIARMGVARAMAIRVPVLDGAGRESEANEIIAESGSLMLWLGVVLSIGIFAASFLITNPYLRSAMRWMSPVGLVTEPYVFLRELAGARHRFNLRSKETIFRGLIELAVVLALCGTLKMAGLGTALVLSIGIAATYLYSHQSVPFRLIPRGRMIKGLIRVGAPFSISEGGYELIRRIDVLVVTVLLGPTSAGYYAVSRLITDCSTLFSQRGIASVLSPHLLFAYGRTGSVNRAAILFEAPARLLSYMAPPLIGVGTFVCGSFIRVLLPQYAPGIPAVQITLWTVFFVALHSTVSSFLVAADIVPAVLRTYGILIPVGVAAEYLVLKANLGLQGAAWCTLVFLAIIGAAEIVIAKRKCGHSYKDTSRFVGCLYLPLIFAVSSRYVIELAGVNSWVPSDSGLIGKPLIEALAFLLLYAPILAIYESKFSLLRVLRQAS